MKTNKLIKAFFALNLLMSPLAIAQGIGDKGGNGGDALICDGKPNELLDSYEARTLLNKSEIDLPAGKKYSDLVQLLITRVINKDLLRGSALQSYWDEIKNEIQTAEAGEATKNIQFTSEKLSEIADELVISIPSTCRLQQLVIQISPEDFNKSAWANRVPRYTIQKALWNSFSEEQKAITITHEFWYRYFLQFGAQSSRNARALNAVFFTKENEKFAVDTYFDLISKTEDTQALSQHQTPLGIVNGRKPLPSTLIKGPILYSDTWGVFKMSEKNSVFVNWLNFDKNTGKVLYLALKAVKGDQICYGACTNKITYKNVYIKSKHDEVVSFYPTGAVKEIYAAKNWPVKKVILLNGTKIKNLTHSLFLDEQGNIINQPAQ